MTRDLTWGANCDGCEERMNAGRAQLAAEDAGDGPLLCGACRDEARLTDERDDARAQAEALAETLENIAAQSTDGPVAYAAGVALRAYRTAPESSDAT